MPLTSAEKMNIKIYDYVKQNNYQLDLNNHSRGGLTASIALKNINKWKGVKNIPIRKARFYGTATNVKDYAEQLKYNNYYYTDKDGKTYQSGVYSAVHQADFVGNKWLLGLVGSNDTTGGACWICYSHSSYFAEVPDPISEKEQFKNFIKVWGKPTFPGDNPSQPKLVNPVNKEGVSNDENPY